MQEQLFKEASVNSKYTYAYFKSSQFNRNWIFKLLLDLSNVKERWEKQRRAFSKKWQQIRLSKAKLFGMRPNTWRSKSWKRLLRLRHTKPRLLIFITFYWCKDDEVVSWKTLATLLSSSVLSIHIVLMWNCIFRASLCNTLKIFLNRQPKITEFDILFFF